MIRFLILLLALAIFPCEQRKLEFILDGSAGGGNARLIILPFSDIDWEWEKHIFISLGDGNYYEAVDVTWFTNGLKINENFVHARKAIVFLTRNCQ